MAGYPWLKPTIHETAFLHMKTEQDLANKSGASRYFHCAVLLCQNFILILPTLRTWAYGHLSVLYINSLQGYAGQTAYQSIIKVPFI